MCVCSVVMQLKANSVCVDCFMIVEMKSVIPLASLLPTGRVSSLFRISMKICVQIWHLFIFVVSSQKCCSSLKPLLFSIQFD